MSRKKQAMDILFDCFVKEGRELGIMEAKRLYPRELSNVRKVAAGSNMRVLFSRMRRVYADRWHEIYDKNIVHEEPKKVEPKKVEPKKVSEPVLSPLEELRTVTRKENE